MNYRTQGQGPGPRVIKECSEPKMVRPEFGPETDVRTIIRRHGGLPPQRKQPIFTETNYDTDLTDAINNLRTAYDAFEQLPEKYRKQYRNADGLWTAYKRGTIIPEPATPNLQEEKTPDGNA